MQRPAAAHITAKPLQGLAADYWEKRKDTLYYQVFRVLTQGLSIKANSMIDIGSGGCPYLDWFPNVPNRASLDIERPYTAPDIESITADFLNWQPSGTYDLVTCLQVLEHISDAGAFAQKLLSIGSIVVVSVPYKWRAGKTEGHVHDPVDEEKMKQWFQREPNFSYICREVAADKRRLIHVYERNDVRWRSLGDRRKKIA